MRSCPDSIFASLACREPGGSTTSCNWQDSNVSTKPGTHGPAHYSFRFRAARRAGGSFSEDFTSFPMRFTRHLRTRRLVHHIDIVRDIVVENETRRHHAGDHEPRAIVRISHTAVKFSQLRLAQWRELRVLRRPVADACVSGRGLERREATQTVHQREPLYWPGAELL